MDYLSLKKLLYSDNASERFERVQTLHMARIESESTFRTGITIGKYAVVGAGSVTEIEA